MSNNNGNILSELVDAYSSAAMIEGDPSIGFWIQKTFSLGALSAKTKAEDDKELAIIQNVKNLLTKPSVTMVADILGGTFSTGKRRESIEKQISHQHVTRKLAVLTHYLFKNGIIDLEKGNAELQASNEIREILKESGYCHTPLLHAVDTSATSTSIYVPVLDNASPEINNFQQTGARLIASSIDTLKAHRLREYDIQLLHITSEGVASLANAGLFNTDTDERDLFAVLDIIQRVKPPFKVRHEPVMSLTPTEESIIQSELSRHPGAGVYASSRTLKSYRNLSDSVRSLNQKYLDELSDITESLKSVRPGNKEELIALLSIAPDTLINEFYDRVLILMYLVNHQAMDYEDVSELSTKNLLYIVCSSEALVSPLFFEYGAIIGRH